MTCWAHSQTSQVVLGTAGRFTQTRGAQQGYVAGSFEASVALAEQARATRARVHQAQADGLIPWTTPVIDPAQLQTKRLEWERTLRNRAHWLALGPLWNQR